jgi:cell division protein ZapA
LANVDISINGRIYAVACDPGQEARVRDLAAMIDERVRRLAGPGHGSPGAIGDTHLLVLAGLMLADELTEAKGALDGRSAGENAVSKEDQDLLVAAVDHLTDRIGVIAARLDRA